MTMQFLNIFSMINGILFAFLDVGPCQDKICLRGFRPGPTQTVTKKDMTVIYS